MSIVKLIQRACGALIGRKSNADLVKKKAVEILAEKLGVSEGEIIPKADLVKDLGAYSLLITEIIMAFEDAFQIKIPDEDVGEMKKVKDILEYLKKKVQ
jgi:acyl carrier protein